MNKEDFKSLVIGGLLFLLIKAYYNYYKLNDKFLTLQQEYYQLEYKANLLDQVYRYSDIRKLCEK